MKKVLILFLALALTACLSPSEDAAPQSVEPTHTSEATFTAALSTAPTTTATEIPFAALPPEEQAALYLAGKVQDVSEMNLDQQKAFSIAANKLIEKIITVEQLTFNNTLPKVIDDEGYTHVYYKENWIKIEGSNKIQLNNFDNFPFPAGEPVDPKHIPEEHQNLIGLTAPEYLYKSEETNMVPIFFLGKDFSLVNISGKATRGAVLSYAITENKPFSVTATIIVGKPVLYADNLRAGIPGDITENSKFYIEITDGKLYYAMYLENQPEAFAANFPVTEGTEATTNYKNGLAPSKQTHPIITGETDSNSSLLLNTLLIVDPGE